MIVCSPQLGISPESNLGGEVHDREMIKALDNLGVETLIILPWGKKYPPLKHSKIYFLPTPFVYPPWLFNLLILPYLFFLYRKYKFEILRVHSPYFVGPAAIFFKLFFPNVKIIVSYLHLETNNKLFNFIDRNLIKHYTAITTISDSTKNEIEKRYQVKSIVIPCGIDLKYKPLPKNEKLLEKYNLKNKKVLLFLGQLIERKNIPFLFKVIKKLPNNYVLMICGDGPLRSQLEKNAPDNVIFTGRILEDEKIDYYNLCDVFVYPSLKEGFGLSVAEAISCGKPVIASNVPIIENTDLKIDYWIKKIKAKNMEKIIYKNWEEVGKAYYENLIRH